MLAIVKLLKRQFDGGRFSNILLAALSKRLKDFCKRKNYDIPKDMTVVIPARLQNSKEDPQLKMENKFSVALQTLPIDIQTKGDRISKIKQYSDKAVASPDYLINYWMMSLVSAIFPDWILKVIMNSKHATMAVSNLPGPTCSIKIDGYEFENVGFFIPNIGQTAVGVTILSYNNKLHFGIMADETAIENENDLGEILQGMKREIEMMSHNVIFETQ
jgi:WS/DGAT C-terminal domain